MPATMVSCMQTRHQDCKQHSCTLRFQHCDQNFFRAPLGIWARRSPELLAFGFCYRYWLCFLSRFPKQNFRAFFRASNGTLFKDPRPTPSPGISKIAPLEESISLSLPVFYALHMCHMWHHCRHPRRCGLQRPGCDVRVLQQELQGNASSPTLGYVRVLQQELLSLCYDKQTFALPQISTCLGGKSRSNTPGTYRFSNRNSSPSTMTSIRNIAAIRTAVGTHLPR